MASLIYSSITSLDGYISDQEGEFDWSMPDPEVHSFVNDLMRPLGTHLYGRRLYEVMVAWETMETTDEPLFVRDFADVWRAADKVVYSTTLQQVSSARTRVERSFDPTAVQRLKDESAGALMVGGAELAAEAIRAGLVDELHQFLSPVVVGGGTHFLPEGIKLGLDLLDERRFDNGVVYVRYQVRS